MTKKDNSLKQDDISTTSSASNELKRKAKNMTPDQTPSKIKKISTDRPKRKCLPQNEPFSKIQGRTSPVSSRKGPDPRSASLSSKTPPKGSFAEIIHRAKTIQSNAPMQIGMIKHQAVSKDRVNKLSAKKKQAQPSQSEHIKPKKVSSTDRSDLDVPKTKPTCVAIAKERDASKGTSRPLQDSVVTYKGTARPSQNVVTATRKKQIQGQGRVRDEYLGTDEEDEGDYGYDNYSDQSSDMEAGLEDVEEEESEALRAARKEDEEELRAEIMAKQEKERRKNHNKTR